MAFIDALVSIIADYWICNRARLWKCKLGGHSFAKALHNEINTRRARDKRNRIDFLCQYDWREEKSIDSYGPELHATNKTTRCVWEREKPIESVTEGENKEDGGMRKKREKVEAKQERRKRRRFVSAWNVSGQDEVNVRKVERKRNKREKIAIAIYTDKLTYVTYCWIRCGVSVRRKSAAFFY